MNCPKIVRGQQQLTPEQAIYAREFARERIAAQLSTAPIDEQKAQEHMFYSYRVVGRKPPVTIRWFDSPFSFVATRVWDGRARDVSGSVRISPMDSVIRSVQVDARGYHLWNEVRNHMSANIGTSMWAIVQTSMPGSAVSVGGWKSVMGSLQAYSDAGELAISRFFHEAFEENKLIHLARFNEMVSGYWLGSRETWLVRKPVILQRDEEGRLHNVSGPCVQYRDGWGWYAWHGVRVPEKVIEHPEQLSRKDWTSERNAEVRRAIQERLGPQRFVELLGGKRIDRGKRGSLIEIKLGSRSTDRVAHYVEVQDSSTERQYLLRVPPSISSADEAVAWTFGLTEADYRPAQET
jgi:hypothetical protein